MGMMGIMMLSVRYSDNQSFISLRDVILNTRLLMLFPDSFK
jgi:hypothetical protein